jgi:hypothetical protein
VEEKERADSQKKRKQSGRGRASSSPIAAIAKLFYSSMYTLTEWPCTKFNRLGSGEEDVSRKRTNNINRMPLYIHLITMLPLFIFFQIILNQYRNRKKSCQFIISFFYCIYYIIIKI